MIFILVEHLLAVRGTAHTNDEQSAQCHEIESHRVSSSECSVKRNIQGDQFHSLSIQSAFPTHPQSHLFGVVTGSLWIAVDLC
jgi:hypothetical protein